MSQHPFLAPATDAVFAHPARVLSVQRGSAPQMDADHLRQLVEAKAFDPAVLTEGRELFFWPAEISSDRLDAFYTRMAATSLRNYAADAAVGVSFQNSHRQYELGFGQSLTGEFVEDAEGQRVRAWFYTISGLRLNEVLTTDLITGIRAGLVKDVSIGFYGGRFVCNVCGRDLWDWECQHIPGLSYEVKGADRIMRTTQAFAWVEDAHLAEVSAVFDGATPGAAILKAQREAEAGRVNDTARQVLEQRYRIHLPAQRRVWQAPAAGGGGLTSGRRPTPPVFSTTDIHKENPMLIREQVQWQDEEGERVSGLLPTALLEDLLDVYEAQATLKSQVAELTTRQTALAAEKTTLGERAQALQARVAEMEPLAEMGRVYKADLVAEALAEGVRALGERFSADVYRPLLEAAPLASVKRMRDDWKAAGDAIFSGGRKTIDGHEPPPASETRTDTAAFKGV